MIYSDCSKNAILDFFFFQSGDLIIMMLHSSELTEFEFIQSKKKKKKVVWIQVKWDYFWSFAIDAKYDGKPY